MSVIKKCCHRYIKRNRRYAILTIIGIILATALLSGVSCIFESTRETNRMEMIKYNGNYHCLFEGVGVENLKVFENHQRIEGYGLMMELGEVMTGDALTADSVRQPQSALLQIAALDRDCMERLKVELVSGRFPENDHELIISKSMITNGGVRMRIGDEISFQGEKYIVTGIMDYPLQILENREAEGFRGITLLDRIPEDADLDVFVRYDAKGIDQYEKVTEGILSVAECAEVNDWVLMAELRRFSVKDYRTAFSFDTLTMMIISLLSVLCIQNSFEISMREKTIFFGQLASIGATRRQRRQFVYYEAFYLGLIGVSIGMIVGVSAIWLLCKAVGQLDLIGGSHILFCISGWTVLLAVVFAFMTVFASAFMSAQKAARMMPISSIRAQEEIKRKRREKSCPKWIKKFFGIKGLLAFQNARRAKRKYRSAVISLMIGFILIMIAGTCSGKMKALANDMRSLYPCQFMAILGDENSREKILEIARMDEITEYLVLQTAGLKMEGKEGVTVSLQILEDECMEAYLKQLGLTQSEVGDRVIAQTKHKVYRKVDKLVAQELVTMADLKDGDMLSGELSLQNQTEVYWTSPVNLEVTTVDQAPRLLGDNVDSLMLFMSRSQFEKSIGYSLERATTKLWANGTDMDKVEEEFFGLDPIRYAAENNDKTIRDMKNTVVMSLVIIYSFFGVMILIGLTNVINTINAQMMIRTQEFGMLKSIGSMEKDLRAMLCLEALYHGAKAMLAGLLIGTLCSFVTHTWFNGLMMTMSPYQFPLLEVMIYVIMMALIMLLMIHYGVGRIKGKNIVTVLRNENI